jgi:cyclophilin family peptidyl-prolyl cis-trans isomerase
MRPRSYHGRGGTPGAPRLAAVCLVLFAIAATSVLTAATNTPKLSETTLADGEEFIAIVNVTQGKEPVGSFTIRLHHKYAPEHVKNFVKLAESGFYEDTKFHRTGGESFIQGGDPLSRDGDPSNDGTGGPGWDLLPEVNEKAFVRGTVGAAQMPNKRDNGSQFFVSLKDHPEWDGKYTAFGSVSTGLEVADKVAAGKRKGEHPVDDWKMSVKVEKRAKQLKLY